MAGLIEAEHPPSATQEQDLVSMHFYVALDETLLNLTH